MYQNIYVDRFSEPAQVYVWDDTEGLVVLPLSQFRYAYVPDPRGKHLTMTGKRVSKTRKFHRGSPNVFESDLPIETRVLTDLYLNEDEPSQGNVILFYDIEVSMKEGIPDVHKANNPITSIALYNPHTQKYTVLVMDEAGLYQNRTSDQLDIIFCNTEHALLHKFITVYEEIAPTIITGWNSNGFDIPYTYNRIRVVCGVETANRLSPIGKVRYSDRLERYVVAGVSSLDYLELYRKFTYTQQPNYRLDTIGRIEIGMGKVEYEGSLDKLFEEDLEKFIEYNLQDVKIIVELDKKKRLIELVRGICHIGHVPYEDYNMSSRFLEGTIVTYLHRKGIVVTDKPQVEIGKAGEKDDSKFTGAFVKEPIPGLYECVYSLDLQSLYPSIIMSLNISPETKVGYVRNYNVEQHIRKEIVAYVVEEVGNSTGAEMDYDTFVQFLEENSLTVSSNGILYSNVKRGIIPEILERWFEKRVEYKDLMKKYSKEGDSVKATYYDQLQHIQKIFLNSMYGYLGLKTGRFYDVDNATAVTISGQDVIKSSAKVVNTHYAKATGEIKDYVTYIDTDSIYASAIPLFTEENSEESPINKTILIAREMEAKLNKFYNTFALRAFNCSSHRLHIKGESVIETGLWTGKKMYALNKVFDLEKNSPTSTLVVKGMSIVRSSFPKAFREFLKTVVEDILRKVPKEEIDNKLLEFRNNMKSFQFLDVARNTSANDISKFLVNNGDSMSTRRGTPIHIKASIAYNRLLVMFKMTDRYDFIRDGEKIKYVYLKRNPLRIPALAIKGYNDPQHIINLVSDYIDYEALFDKELRNKLEDIYLALGWGILPTDVNTNSEEFFTWE
jgi:DNA polymerase elongation subunit (family B)